MTSHITTWLRDAEALKDNLVDSDLVRILASLRPPE